MNDNPFPRADCGRDADRRLVHAHLRLLGNKIRRHVGYRVRVLVAGPPLAFRIPNNLQRYAWDRPHGGQVVRVATESLLGVVFPTYGRELGKYLTTPSCTTVATGRPARSKK